ncbi:hypothetical protein [Mucilaginibacter sp. 22184]|uniref:hypothetical protein n=1 Tax=Mucilaginibacter sp. 22184 TaxID=3453887 RepID=UPI003F87A080
MIYFKSGRLCFLLSLLAAVFVISSCKKEYLKYPYNDIERFTIKDANGTEIKASIEGSDIIVYYPPFMAVPDFINPQITVSERAVIEPASGAQVAFKTGVTFKVKAQDGSVKTYTLKPAINQPNPAFEVGDSRLGDVLVLFGEYMVPDASRTKLYIVDKNNKETQLPGSSFTEFTASRLIANIPISIDTGSYRVKLKTGSLIQLKGPIHIAPPDLSLVVPATITTVKRGGTLSITSDNGSLKYYKQIFVRATMSIDIFTEKPVNIVSITNDEIKLQVPIDLPLIKIENIYLYDKNDTLYGIDRSGNGIQVTE